MLDNMINGAAASGTGEQVEAPPPIAEFEGYAECALFSEEVKITLAQDEMIVAALFDQLVLPYAEISSFAFENYRTVINTADGIVTFSRMGQEAEWLYDKLFGAYNDAVLKALLVEGEHIFEAPGDFIIEEGTVRAKEHGMIRLYDDCLCLLPPNENARRVPLCFMTGMEKSDYSRTLLLSTGERYTVTKMGRELDNLDRLLTARLRALREQTLSWHKELAPNIAAMQAAAVAKLMPFGTAAMLSKLSAASSALADSIEAKIKQSRMAGTYPWLKKLCGDDSLTLGAKPAPPKEDEEETAAAEQSETETGETEQEPVPILWAAAPDADKRVAAVELALAENEAAATYLYRIEGEWEVFARKIDRGLEASGFKRELITLPDEKLRLPEHRASAMLIKRTPTLQLMRSCFIGRAIHSSEQRWRNDIEKCRTSVSKESNTATNQKEFRFCTNCGAKLKADAKFCGQCGSKQQ